MRRVSLIALAVSAGAAAVALAAPAGAPSVASKPPSVVQTIPVAGDTRVDPGLQEIRVTFSKDMLTEKMWSWVQESAETFPATRGEVRYVDARTCVLPVKLAPGKTYVIWINSQKFNAFRDTGNRPAVPYQLVFETRK